MCLPPGPSWIASLGFFGRGSIAGTLRFLEETARTYGPISSFRVLHQRIYLVDDPELIREILVKQQHSFVRDTGAALLRELVGDGLLTRDEPLHKERRRVLQPAFHREQIESYAKCMWNECKRTLIQWRGTTTSLDMGIEMRRLTLAIVGAALFGSDFREGSEGIAQVLRSVMRRSTRVTPFLAVMQPLVKSYRRYFPNGRSLFFESERKELETILRPLIANRRQTQRRDVISLLLAAGELNDGDVMNEVVTFVLAGHETTATALTWAWYLLARHTPVQDRLNAEVDEVCPEGPITLEHCSRLKYTTMVFQEVMRLYPPAPAFARKTAVPVELAGYHIPAGISIFLSPYATQRNPQYFENPLAFRPERWENIDIPKFAYFPFGGGAKMCIGEPFANLEGVIVLAALARSMRFELDQADDQGGAPGIGGGITLQPDRPIRTRVMERRSPELASTYPTEA